MPFFDYKCPKCGNEQEELVKSHTQEVKCKKCDTKMNKQISRGVNPQTWSRRIR